MKQIAGRILKLLSKGLDLNNTDGLVTQSASMWEGDYKLWANALEITGKGYASDNILKKVLDATLQVKQGLAAYERDSVIFEKPQRPWPLIASLLYISSIQNQRLNVIDFGGSLGSSYFHTNPYLKSVQNLRWTVVEQAEFVNAGNNLIAHNGLSFTECLSHDLVDEHSVVLLSGVLQYLPEPFQWIRTLTTFNFQHILIDRTAFIDGPTRLCVQNVPKEIYEASYPAWFFNEDDFVLTFSEHFSIEAEFGSYADPDAISEDQRRLYWKGFHLRKRDYSKKIAEGVNSSNG